MTQQWLVMSSNWFNGIGVRKGVLNVMMLRMEKKNNNNNHTNHVHQGTQQVQRANLAHQYRIAGQTRCPASNEPLAKLQDELA